MSIAAKVALDKEKHPDKFCPSPHCLWKTGGGYCPRHLPANLQMRINKELLSVLKEINRRVEFSCLPDLYSRMKKAIAEAEGEV